MDLQAENPFGRDGRIGFGPLGGTVAIDRFPQVRTIGMDDIIIPIADAYDVRQVAWCDANQKLAADTKFGEFVDKNVRGVYAEDPATTESLMYRHIA